MSIELTELKRVLHEWSAVPFPEDSDDDQLSGIHADLVLYDSDVVGCITSLLSGIQVQLSCLEDHYRLEQRLEQVLTKADRCILKDAEAYYTYLQGLQNLVALARQWMLRNR